MGTAQQELPVIRTRGVTPILTISAEEMCERCLQAAFALHAGKRVVLQPGVFRASKLTFALEPSGSSADFIVCN